MIKVYSLVKFNFIYVVFLAESRKSKLTQKIAMSMRANKIEKYKPSL